MTENINQLEKKDSIGGEVLLDWKDFDDDEEEEEDKNENASEKEKSSYSKKKSESHEESNYNEPYYSKNSRSNKDYSYSGSSYNKNYSSYHSKKSYGYKKYGRSKPYNKGYDNGYDNNYYNSSSYYKKWNNYGNDDYYKYKDKGNYYEPKKMIEKELEYDTKEDNDKDNNNNDDNYENNEITIDFNKKLDKKNFNNNKYYNNKKYGYNSRYNKNNVGYNTREFNEEKKAENKNNKFRRFKEEEIGDKNEEEDIKKPLFYNSKIQRNEEMPMPQNNFVKIEDFIKFENLKEDINNIVKETYLDLKAKINKDLEEQYGSLNINAKTYIPKKKILGENYNYGQNFVNNNNNPNIFQQNVMTPSY